MEKGNFALDINSCYATIMQLHCLPYTIIVESESICRQVKF